MLIEGFPTLMARVFFMMLLKREKSGFVFDTAVQRMT